MGSRGLSVDDLDVVARRGVEVVPIVEGVCLRADVGAAHGIVGETGAGKTMTARAMLGLLPPGVAATGTMQLGDQDPIDLASGDSVRCMLGHEIGVLLQNPGAMFDPLVRVGRQMIEGVVRKGVLTKVAARDRGRELLREAGFTDPDRVMSLYPHELSGGMAQRVGIASAVLGAPKLVLADEPTSALDASIRLDVLRLLDRVTRESGAALVIISHDLGLISRFCSSVTVLYAGHVAEQGPTRAVLDDPQHPYTRALLDCIPTPESRRGEPLRTIPGAPPAPGQWPAGCVFAPRCPLAHERARLERPMLRSRDAHAAACHLAFGGDS
jgi:oligopeptide/dipeptide ABC transporter ATP-binding protein